MRLASQPWSAVASRPAPLLAMPLGSCEQHGPHLPLDTDTAVASALVDALAARRGDVVAAPALPYGASGEHAAFAGTLSLGTEALATALIELVRSADHFAGVVVVSGHGGNADALTTTSATAAAEGRHLLAWSPTSHGLPPGPGGRPPDAHAGWVETSVMLHLQPDAVDLVAAAPGDTRPLGVVAGDLRAGGVGAVSPTGVLGDPTGSCAALGAAVLAVWADALAVAVDRWRAVVPA